MIGDVKISWWCIDQTIIINLNFYKNGPLEKTCMRCKMQGRHI